MRYLSKKLLAVTLAALILAGCTQRQPTPQPSSEQPSSQPQQEQSGDASALDFTGLVLQAPAKGDSSPLLQDFDYMGKTVRLAFWQHKEQVYQVIELPIPKEGVTSLSVVQTVANALGFEFDVNSITRHKQMLVLDLPSSLVRETLSDPTTEAMLLNSISMTLLINGNDVGFTMDGGQYSSANITLPNDRYGSYQPPELKLAVKAGEYDAIRASIPYPGLCTRYFEIPDYILSPDATGKALADYLAMVGLPREDFDSSSQIDPAHLLEQALLGSYLYQDYVINPEYQPDFLYQPQLFPITVAVGDSSVYLREHVEQSARLIFGDSVTIQHQDVQAYTWHEAEGVYTPPHMGGGGPNVPVIFSYEDKGDRYEAEVAYMQYGLDCFFVDDQPASGQKLLDYVQNQAARYRVVVLKKGDHLQIQSIHKI